MDPVGHELGDLLAGPLGSHVAHTLDGHEVEAFVGLGVAGNLTLGEPGLPGIGDFPVEVVDPLAGAGGGNGTIGITGVEHHSDLVLEDVVDPLGGLDLGIVLELVRALLPSLHVSGHVESGTDIFTVHVVSEHVTANHDFVSSRGILQVIGKVGVLSLSDTTSVALLFAVDHGGSEAVVLIHLSRERSHGVGSVEIVPVETLGEHLDFGQGAQADLGAGNGLDVV